MKQREDSQDPYIYTSTTKMGSSRRPRNTNGASGTNTQKLKRGPKPGTTRGKRAANLAPPADFGARLFAGLKADISSDETGGRRRRAYTEMDDLLADDIKKGEQASSEIDMARQRSNPFSDRGSTSRTKKQQLSEMGCENKGRVSIQLGAALIEGLGPETNNNQGFSLKKRESKQ